MLSCMALPIEGISVVQFSITAPVEPPSSSCCFVQLGRTACYLLLQVGDGRRRLNSRAKQPAGCANAVEILSISQMQHLKTTSINATLLTHTPTATKHSTPPGISKAEERSSLDESPHCQQPICIRSASYASSNEKVPAFCEKHKLDGMENVVHPNRGNCIHEGCARVSSYASTGDTIGIFCHLHKEQGMVKVRDKIGSRCEETTCVKQASFAIECQQYPRFCKDHKQQGMINIRHQYCLAHGCSRGASFAVDGDQRGIYCGEHKLAGMINTPQRFRAPYASSSIDTRSTVPDTRRDAHQASPSATPPEPDSPIGKNSDQLPEQESTAVGKWGNLEGNQPQGYARTPFYFNLVKALIKK